MAVVERDVRRWPQHDENALSVHAQTFEHARVGLEVGRRRARDAEPACTHRELVRPVREREVEVARPRPAAESPQPGNEGASLPEAGTTTVASDHGCVQTM